MFGGHWILQQENFSRLSQRKSPKFSFLKFKLTYTKSGVQLLEPVFIACPGRMGAPSQPCIGLLNSKINFISFHRLIWDLGQQVPCACHILDLKISQSLMRGGKRRSQKFHPFMEIGYDTLQANELLIARKKIRNSSSIPIVFSKKDQTHNFVPL